MEDFNWNIMFTLTQPSQKPHCLDSIAKSYILLNQLRMAKYSLSVLALSFLDTILGQTSHLTF